MESLYKFFNKKQRERTCYVLHGYDDFVTILRDLQISGGQMLTALNIQDEPIGMIFFHPAGDHIYVKELMYDNDHIKNLLLQEADNAEQSGKGRLPHSFHRTGNFPLRHGTCPRPRPPYPSLGFHPRKLRSQHRRTERNGHPISYPPVARLPEPGGLYEFDARLVINFILK